MRLMSYWGKLLGGVAGFALGGPFGAVVGAALGHAADSGGLPRIELRRRVRQRAVQPGPARRRARAARTSCSRSASSCCRPSSPRCDGPVVRAEIDAFKRQFRIPPEAVRDIGRLFDQARDSAEGFEPYAEQLGESFADNRGLLEDVLAALFAIARADKPLTVAEHEMLRAGARAVRPGQPGLGPGARRAPRAAARRGGRTPTPCSACRAAATDEELRAAWLRLMRENHPDSLAARGVPAEFIARASEKVARINAAWDRIKRERGL